MEVDLLCAEAGVVIELDGAQHLADAEAYRRDRRKDALLQQNGFFVLRFLAEDVGKHLDHVLDAHLGDPRPSWEDPEPLILGAWASSRKGKTISR
jgi:very-short-patch-repair endonuclease